MSDNRFPDSDFFRSTADEIHALFFSPAPPRNRARMRTQLEYAVQLLDKRAHSPEMALRRHVQSNMLTGRLGDKEAGPPKPGWKWIGQASLIEIYDVFTQGAGVWCSPDLLKPPAKQGSPLPGAASQNDSPDVVLTRHYLTLAMVHDHVDAVANRRRGKLCQGFDLPSSLMLPVFDVHGEDPSIHLLPGFDLKSVERALEAVRADLAGETPGTGEHQSLEDRLVTLQEFMESYCENREPKRVASLRKTLQSRARNKKIQLPRFDPSWKPGGSKYYWAADLIKQWPSYRRVFPPLPDLKPSVKPE